MGTVKVAPGRCECILVISQLGCWSTVSVSPSLTSPISNRAAAPGKKE